MDWNQVEGNWKQVKGNVKRQWGKLTDADLTAIDGREELEGKIQERYGYTKDRIRKEIDDWYRSMAYDLSRKSEDLADQIDAIRADLDRLTSTVTRVADTQLERAQDGAVEAATQVEDQSDAIPLLHWRLLLGLGSCLAHSHVAEMGNTA
jgi:uncharacterized protein YjbJ (UPF0337 family)